MVSVYPDPDTGKKRTGTEESRKVGRKEYLQRNPTPPRTFKKSRGNTTPEYSGSTDPCHKDGGGPTLETRRYPGTNEEVS